MADFATVLLDSLDECPVCTCPRVAFGVRSEGICECECHDERTLGNTRYGFQWGPAEVTRMAHIEGRGRVIGVRTPHDSIQVYVTEKGRSIRVWRGNVELGRQ